MPPRTRRTTEEPDTTVPTRNLPQNAEQVARLLERQPGANIVTTGLSARRNELAGSVRASVDTARSALQYSISHEPENWGHDAVPDFVLRERASADFNRISNAIREGQRRARFR